MILENSVVNDLLSHYIFLVFSLKVPVPHMELWIHQIIGWSDIWPGNPAFVYPVPVSSWPKDRISDKICSCILVYRAKNFQVMKNANLQLITLENMQVCGWSKN